jgi:hypothetical protein
MADSIGPKELRLRELAKRTREGKNFRAQEVRTQAQMVDDHRRDVAQAALRKANWKARQKKKAGKGRKGKKQ